MRKCPVCEAAVSIDPPPATFPFCSDRCKVIDLGKWLSGSYRIPDRATDDGDAPAPPPAPTDKLH